MCVFIGFIQGEEDEDSAPLMVLEFMQYGDLCSFLKAHRYINIMYHWNWKHIHELGYYHVAFKSSY